MPRQAIPIEPPCARRFGQYGIDSMRRTKASIIYKAARNLRAVQILLGRTKIESTVRYLGVDVEDTLTLAKGTEIWYSSAGPDRLA